MAHGFFCKCKKCNPSIMDMVFGSAKKKGNFSKKLKDGTTIYGPKSFDGKPGHKHGHRGPNFNRTPHSSLGAAAIGKPHSTKDHKTDRW